MIVNYKELIYELLDDLIEIGYITERSNDIYELISDGDNRYEISVIWNNHPVHLKNYKFVSTTLMDLYIAILIEWDKLVNKGETIGR